MGIPGMTLGETDVGVWKADVLKVSIVKSDTMIARRSIQAHYVPWVPFSVVEEHLHERA